MCYTGFCICVFNMFALMLIVNYKQCISLAFGIHSHKLRLCRLCILKMHFNIPIKMCASTKKVYLKSQGTPSAINCFVTLVLKQKKGLLPYSEYSANRLPSVHANELTFKMHLNFCIWSCRRSFLYCQPIGMCLNLSDMADKQDSSDRQKPLWSRCRLVTLFGPLSHVSVCDAMVTVSVKGGAFDLCLTNGSFIIPVPLA